jgi:hypothetical protein
MDQLRCDEIGYAQEDSGDDHEAKDHTGGLHHLRAIRPLNSLKLSPASAQEPGKPSWCRLTAQCDGRAGTVTTLVGVIGVVELIDPSHSLPLLAPSVLARLAVRGMPLAPLAVLVKLQPLRVVALALIRLVVAALALLAGEGRSDPHVSTGHGSSPRTVFGKDALPIMWACWRTPTALKRV